MRYPVKILDQNILPSKTLLIELSKPDEYSFQPGQYLNLYLEENSEENNRDLKHTFSIAAAPSAPNLLIASRIRESSFKSSLSNMRAGDTLYVGSPGGSFILPSTLEENNLVFVAAGIGITPVLSMLSHLAESAVNSNLFLLWSNRSLDSAPLIDQVKKVVDEISNIKSFYFFTGEDIEAPQLSGRIDLNSFNENQIPIQNSIFYLVGTESFVTDMHSLLNAYGVPYNKIVSDSFGGY